MKNPENPHIYALRALSLLFGVIILLLVLSCTSGKSVQNNSIYQRSEVATVQKDSTNNNKEHVRSIGTYAHDSIYNSDSVVVVIVNDTVLKDRWHIRTREKTKYVFLTDTLVKQTDIYHYKTDTLKYYINRTKYKEVEKKLSWWENMKMKIGGFSIFTSIIFAILYALEGAKRRDEQQINK